MLLYLLLIKVIYYCNFVTCNSLLPNTDRHCGRRKKCHFIVDYNFSVSWRIL